MLLLSSVCLLLVSVTSTVLSAPAATDGNCTDKFIADVYILVDGSNSINSVGWGRALTFISNLIQSFPVIGPENVQFAYGTFSTSYLHMFDLNKYYDKNVLSQVVLDTTQLKGVTYTFDALRAIRLNSYLNSTGHGARSGVQKILIVITDGNSDDITQTIDEADALRRDQGVRIIVVSVGHVNQVECIGVANTEDNVFNVKQFSALDAIKRQITQRVCTEPKTAPEQCPDTVPVDLVFIIDSSGSIGEENFQKNFEFVVKSVRGFSLDSQSVRVALITFATTPKVIFPLTSNKVVIYEKLSDVPYQDGITNTYLALEKAQQLLTSDNDEEQQSKKVVVLVYDGESTDINKTLNAARDLRNEQVIVITLGVGSNVRREEIELVASKRSYSFIVTDYSALITFATQVSDILCKVQPPVIPVKPPPVPVDPCTSGRIVDIFFLVDSSGSIGLANYKYNFEFIRTIVDAYDIGENAAKVALLTFGSSVKPKFKLSGDEAFIQQQLLNVPYQHSTTNTHKALAYILDKRWNKPENGAREQSQVIILITDGRSSDPEKTLIEAARVKASGIIIIVVGVTKNIDQNELNAIASKPEYVFNVNNYSDLKYFAKQISDSLCSEATASQTPTKKIQLLWTVESPDSIY